MRRSDGGQNPEDKPATSDTEERGTNVESDQQTDAPIADQQTDSGTGLDDGETESQTIREMIEEQEENDTNVSVFANPRLVDPNTIIDADRIVGRDEQLNQIISFLRPVLNGHRPPNMLLYGPSGTGKSLIINAVAEQINELCVTRDISFGVIRLNCQAVDTLDRAAYEFVTTVADDVDVDPGVPPTGVSTKQKFNRLYELVSTHYEVALFVLDEIDYLKGRRDRDEPAYSRILYQLSRASVEGEIDGQVSVAALTNDPQFMKNIDGRAESSFNPDDVTFPDYDANQLRSILKHRRDAFRDGALTEDVIPLGAAFAAQSHGDARKAIDLIRKAGELADKYGHDQVTEEHVREAQSEIDVDRTQKLIEGLSTQKKLCLYATAAVHYYSHSSLDSVPSPVGYEVYKWLTESIDADQMTRETYVKYVKELEAYGLIVSERRGRGRGRGMHMEFQFGKNTEAMIDHLTHDSRLTSIEDDLLKSVVNAQVNDFLD
ncbi:orc1/cdc6 family replication initiation protein [Halorussus ruber]|uniref:orc1/cdc6 family replication initiation protein n=1 Tax=Halorussus ruber TaxID=1126238 RepID=UPI0037430C37